MNYLGLALYAEGPTDYYFLKPLLYRLCEDICLSSATIMVEISEVLGVDHEKRINNNPREIRILNAAESSRDSWNILFVHADAGSNGGRVRSEQIEPALKNIREHLPRTHRAVAVIPVRETEAWVLADSDAVCEIFGANLAARELGLPTNTGMVERIADPKQLLQGALSRSRPKSRAHAPLASYLNSLGEQVSLMRLRQLAAFQMLEAELRAELRQLNVV